MRLSAAGGAALNADERQHQIVALARRLGEVDVAKLAAELDVSAETIRRDLRLLEKHGLIRRTHGGAYPVETAKFETDLAIKSSNGDPRYLLERLVIELCAR